MALKISEHSIQPDAELSLLYFPRRLVRRAG
jgi:hypothetical protein